MAPNCPECGGPLASALGEADEDTYVCLAPDCEVGALDPDEAPAVTGSPLDVRASEFGEVRVYVPDPRRGMDTHPIRFDPDAARRLAEALEQAAADAERRGEA